MYTNTQCVIFTKLQEVSTLRVDAYMISHQWSHPDLCLTSNTNRSLSCMRIEFISMYKLIKVRCCVQNMASKFPDEALYGKDISKEGRNVFLEMPALSADALHTTHIHAPDIYTCTTQQW